MNTKLWKQRLKEFFSDLNTINQEKAIGMHEWEMRELRNVFALLVLGNFTGIPAPPVHITTELLPEMEDDLHIMMERINVAHDPLGELFSVMDIG